MTKAIAILILMLAPCFGQQYGQNGLPNFGPNTARTSYFDGSKGCGNVSPSYVFATFNGTSNKIEMFFGPNITTYCYMPALLTPQTITARDPRIVKLGSTWYMAATDPTNTNMDWFLYSSPDAVTWTSLGAVSTSSTGLQNTQAPSWFVDTDGSLHIVVDVCGASHSACKVYEQHCSSSTAPTNTCFSNPSLITITAENGPIDPFVTCIATGAIPCTSGTSGNTYYLFYTTGVPDTYGTMQYASASSLTGTYTDVGTGNWAGFGCSNSTPCEGAYLQYVSGTWYLSFDWVGTVNGSLTTGQVYWSTSTNFTGASAGTWATKQPIGVGAIQAKHGSILAYP